MYNKLFTKILDSSIWLESQSTRIVWLTLLAAMDQDGMARFASGANLAHRARVTIEEAAAAVKLLESPDPHSSDPDNAGRRIERVPGGWLVMNAPKYRATVTALETRRLQADRSKRYRDGKKNKRDATVTQRDEVAKRHAPVTQSEAETFSLKEGTALAAPVRPEDYDYGFGRKKELPNGFDY